MFLRSTSPPKLLTQGPSGMTTWEKAMSRYWPESLPLHPIRPHVLFQRHGSAGTQYTENQQWRGTLPPDPVCCTSILVFISSPCYTFVPYSAQTPDGRKVFESVSLLCRSPPARGSQTLVPSVEKVFNAVLSQEKVFNAVLSQEQQVHVLSDDS